MSFQTARFESALYEQPAGACTSCSRSVVLTSVGVSERTSTVGESDVEPGYVSGGSTPRYEHSLMRANVP
tara:strand:+ start:404 stop:613 length:210 start_codon:yes stop_codon:yes gene_type:complete